MSTNDDHPPLQRDTSLQPFSRDHFLALRVARDLTEAATADAAGRKRTRDAFVLAWQQEIASHFLEEEQLLIPLMLPEEIKRLRREHENLRRLAAEAQPPAASDTPLQTWCAIVGRELCDHVRWEERVLFQAIQQRATPEQLRAVGAVTAEIEKRRLGIRKRGPGPRKA